jgi:hypothetical protein
VADLTGVATKLQALAVGAVTGLKGVQAHGDITDPEFPGAHFHRGLSVGMPATDYRTGETGTNRAMSPRYKLCRLAVRVGYLFGRDEMAAGATVRGSFDDASLDAQSDLDAIEAAVTQTTAWAGASPTWVSARRSGATSFERIADLNRALATVFFDVEVSIT